MKNIFLLFIACCMFARPAMAQQQELNRLPYIDTNSILLGISNAAGLENTDPDSCIALLAPWLQQSRQINFARGIAGALVHAGMANMAKGATDVALHSYKMAEKYVSASLYDKQLLALFHTAIGSPYLKKEDFRQAGAHYYNAQKIVTENKLQSTAIAARLYLNLSDLWWHMKRNDYAMSYMRKSEDIAVKLHDTAVLVAVYANLGNLYYGRNNIEIADSYMHQALLLARQKHIIRAQQILLSNLGVALRQEGDPAAAIPYFLKAMALADDKHAYRHNLLPCYQLAFSYYETGDYKKAKYYILKAIQQSEGGDAGKEHIDEGLQTMAAIYKKEGRYREANEWLDKYIAYLENTLEHEADSSINKLEDYYRFSEKNKQIAQKQLLLAKRELELKNKNLWIGGISGGVLLLCMALFIVWRTARHRQAVQAMHIRSLEQEKQLLYLKATMEGEEKERMRLARELHDGIGGMLTAARMNLGSVKEANSQLKDITALDDVMRLLTDTAAEVRQTAHNLMPDALENNSLKDALMLYCTDVNMSGQIDVQLQFYGQLEDMNKSAELILYRITQELVQNTIKHARASQLVIQIIQDNGRLNLVVEDNGVGFDPVETEKGAGLQNLRSRVQALQGYISVTSAVGQGTSVYIEFDLEKIKYV